MTIETTYTLTFGPIGGSTPEFTDRLIGWEVRHNAQVGNMGRGSAAVTLLNNDGALTPAAIGGTGTYKDVDWFAQPCFITAVVTGAATVLDIFHGVVDTFKMGDDGVNSTAQITAVDIFSLTGRSDSAAITGNAWGTTAEVVAGLYTDGPFGGAWEATTLPALGQATPAAPVVDMLSDDVGQIYYQVLTETAAARANIHCFPSGPLIGLPTTLVLVTGEYVATVAVLARTMTRNTDTIIALVEGQPADLAADQLPFAHLEVGDDQQSVINFCSNAPWWSDGTLPVGLPLAPSPPVVLTAANTAAVDLYGVRAKSLTGTWTLQWSDTYYGDTPNLWDGLTSQGELQDTAQNLAACYVNRYAISEFDRRQLTITDGMLAAAPDTSREEWRALIDVTTGHWRTVSVTATPTGGAQTVSHHQVAGRRWQGTPGNVKLTIDLVPMLANRSLTLNDTVRGNLNEMRIG